MGYTGQEGMVRADRFRPSGKWYDTFALDMSEFYAEPLIHDALDLAIRDHQKGHQGHPCATPDDPGWFIVVAEPYHQHAHPIVAWSRSDGTWGRKDEPEVGEVPAGTSPEPSPKFQDPPKYPAPERGRCAAMRWGPVTTAPVGACGDRAEEWVGAVERHGARAVEFCHGHAQLLRSELRVLLWDWKFAEISVKVPGFR